jgi:hypothetical protein
MAQTTRGGNGQKIMSIKEKWKTEDNRHYRLLAREMESRQGLTAVGKQQDGLTKGHNE